MLSWKRGLVSRAGDVTHPRGWIRNESEHCIPHDTNTTKNRCFLIRAIVLYVFDLDSSFFLLVCESAAAVVTFRRYKMPVLRTSALRHATALAASKVAPKIAPAATARYAGRWSTEKLPMGPPDPILGLNDAFNKDTDPKKVRCLLDTAETC